jgi:hypothetical protein
MVADTYKHLLPLFVVSRNAKDEFRQKNKYLHPEEQQNGNNTLPRTAEGIP